MYSGAVEWSTACLPRYILQWSTACVPRSILEWSTACGPRSILEQWSGLPRACRDISWSGLPRACRDIFWSGLPRAGRDLFWSNRMVYRAFAEIHWGVVYHHHHHHRQRRLAHIFVSHVCNQGPAQRDLCAGLTHFARPLPSWSYPAPLALLHLLSYPYS